MTILEDLKRYVPKYAETSGIVRLARCVAAILLHPGWCAIFNFRLAQGFRVIYLHPVSWLIYRFNMHMFAIDIHPSVRLGKGAWLPHPFGIVIARDAKIGDDSTIYQNVTIGGRGQPPVIGNNVCIGAGACVLGPSVVADNVTIGANTVVTHDVPAGKTVVGAPMREIE